MRTLRQILRHMCRALDAQRPVLTVPQACRLLQLSDKSGREWLEQHGLIVEVNGQPRVIQKDIISLLETQAQTVRNTVRGKRAPSWETLTQRAAS